MKGIRVAHGRNWGTTWGAAALAMIMASGIALGNDTNAIPYDESFEGVPQGTLLSGAGGWYGISNAIEVVAGNPNYMFGYGLPGVTHSNVLELTESVTNLYVVGETDGTSPSTNGVNNPPWVNKKLWIDLMVNPVPRDSAPANLDENVQAAVFLDADGHLNIYHRSRGDILEPPPEQPADWTALSHPAIGTDTWFRLTITMAYLTDPFSTLVDPDPKIDTYYKVQVNGGDALTHPRGRVEPWYYLDQTNTASTTATNGEWFLTANANDMGDVNYWLTSLSTEGPGLIDDVIVTNAAPAGASGNPYNIPASVYVNNGIWDPDGDDDMDGVPNWEELVAGTDPGMASSIFQITDQVAMGSSNVVVFTASDAYVSATVTMLRTEDLVNGPWNPVGTVVPSASGVNSWADTAPPAGQAYYKPVIQWDVGD